MGGGVEGPPFDYGGNLKAIKYVPGRVDRDLLKLSIHKYKYERALMAPK